MASFMQSMAHRSSVRCLSPTIACKRAEIELGQGKYQTGRNVQNHFGVGVGGVECMQGKVMEEK